MTHNKAVMKMALDALGVATTPLAKDRREVLRAMVALRAAIAQPEQAVNQTDIDHIFETIYDHGNGKYQGAVSKAQRDKAIAICEALGQSIAQPEKTNPAPGYCKSCKEYTIEEPMVAQPEQNAAANKTLSTLIYRIKNLNDNRLLQWELTDTFTEYQAAVAQPKAQP